MDNTSPYRFEESGALRLKNSPERVKSRIHFLSNSGPANLYAVAAVCLGENPQKLDWFDRKFSLLYCWTDIEGKKTWYKVNLVSFRKRFRFSEKEMEKIADEHGIINQTMLDAKIREIEEWKSVCSGPESAFSQNFIQNLVDAGLPTTYKKVIFWKNDTDFSEILKELENVEKWHPHEILLVQYKNKDDQIFRFLRSYLDGEKNLLGLIREKVIFHAQLNFEEYTDVKKGGNIPSNILERIYFDMYRLDNIKAVRRIIKKCNRARIYFLKASHEVTVLQFSPDLKRKIPPFPYFLELAAIEVTTTHEVHVSKIEGNQLIETFKTHLPKSPRFLNTFNINLTELSFWMNKRKK